MFCNVVSFIYQNFFNQEIIMVSAQNYVNAIISSRA